MVMMSSQESGKREAAEQQQVRRQHHPWRGLEEAGSPLTDQQRLPHFNRALSLSQYD